MGSCSSDLDLPKKAAFSEYDTAAYFRLYPQPNGNFPMNTRFSDRLCYTPYLHYGDEPGNLIFCIHPKHVYIGFNDSGIIIGSFMHDVLDKMISLMARKNIWVSKYGMVCYEQNLNHHRVVYKEYKSVCHKKLLDIFPKDLANLIFQYIDDRGVYIYNHGKFNENPFGEIRYFV